MFARKRQLEHDGGSLGSNWGLQLRAIIQLAFLAAMVVASSKAFAAGSIALVIGNSVYEHAPQLQNPRNDAQDIGQALSSLGFAVTTKLDVGHFEMQRVLRDFAVKSRDAQIALIYYSGHGIEVAKQNFLIPTDAQLISEQDVEFESVELDQMIRAAAGASELALVLVDACRDNPFSKTMDRGFVSRSVGRGLARVDPVEGILVSFAAQEGSVAEDGVGRNSPYAAAIISELADPNVDVSILFRKVRDHVMAATGKRQRPYTYGSLPGRPIFLVPTLPLTPTIKPTEKRAKDLVDHFKIPSDLVPVPTARPPFEAPENANQSSKLAEASDEFIYLANKPHDYRNGENYIEELELKRRLASLSSYRMKEFRDFLNEIYIVARNISFGDVSSEDKSRAVNLYKIAADAGHREAAFELGKMYQTGKGVTANSPRAITYFELAAMQGHELAQLELGFAFSLGELAQGDYAKSFAFFKRAADQGNAKAQFNIADFYFEGTGVAQNKVEAAKFYALAADQGDDNAQVQLGGMYFRGEGVKQDKAEAARLFKLAADQHNAIAQYALGVMHFKGDGVNQDTDESVRLFRLARSNDNADAKTGWTTLFGDRDVSVELPLESKVPDKTTHRLRLDGSAVAPAPASLVAAVETAPTPVLEAASEKMTQRLLKDGSEVDSGAGGAGALSTEGTSFAKMTPPEPVADVSVGQRAILFEKQRLLREVRRVTVAGQKLQAALDLQRAIFYEERTSAEEGSALAGAVVWTVVQESPGNDLPPEPAIQADVTIPDLALNLRMTIRRNADTTLPASHIIELLFSTPADFPGGAIDQVQRVTLKSTEQATGNPLVALPAKIADSFFLVALNNAPTALEANQTLLRREAWLDIPVVYRTGRRGLITMEKGIPGDKVFDEALQAWAAKTAQPG
jgi:TPR repeat protein